MKQDDPINTFLNEVFNPENEVLDLFSCQLSDHARRKVELKLQESELFSEFRHEMLSANKIPTDQIVPEALGSEDRSTKSAIGRGGAFQLCSLGQVICRFLYAQAEQNPNLITQSDKEDRVDQLLTSELMGRLADEMDERLRNGPLERIN